jgi:hypothetical protein
LATFLSLVAASGQQTVGMTVTETPDERTKTIREHREMVLSDIPDLVSRYRDTANVIIGNLRAFGQVDDIAVDRIAAAQSLGATIIVRTSRTRAQGWWWCPGLFKDDLDLLATAIGGGANTVPNGWGRIPGSTNHKPSAKRYLVQVHHVADRGAWTVAELARHTGLALGRPADRLPALRPSGGVRALRGPRRFPHYHLAKGADGYQGHRYDFGVVLAALPVWAHDPEQLATWLSTTSPVAQAHRDPLGYARRTILKAQERLNEPQPGPACTVIGRE